MCPSSRSAVACRLPSPAASSAHGWLSTAKASALIFFMTALRTGGVRQGSGSVTQRESIAGGGNGSEPWQHALQRTASTLLGLSDPWGALADGGSSGGSNSGGGGGGTGNFINEVLSQLGPLGLREALRSVACMLAIESNLTVSPHSDHVDIGDERITGGRDNIIVKLPVGHRSGGLDGEMKRNKDGTCWGSRLTSLMDASSQLLSSLKDAALKTSPPSRQSSMTELLTAISSTLPAAHACLVAVLQVIISNIIDQGA